MIGDASYTSKVFADPAIGLKIPGQVTDEPSWKASLQRVRHLRPARVHFCHDMAITDGRD